jgi:hypothetical protein
MKVPSTWVRFSSSIACRRLGASRFAHRSSFVSEARAPADGRAQAIGTSTASIPVIHGRPASFTADHFSSPAPV